MCLELTTTTMMAVAVVAFLLDNVFGAGSGNSSDAVAVVLLEMILLQQQLDLVEINVRTVAAAATIIAEASEETLLYGSLFVVGVDGMIRLALLTDVTYIAVRTSTTMRRCPSSHHCRVVAVGRADCQN